ncbi:MAG: ATP-binding protein [Chitinophagia bacterium]
MAAKISQLLPKLFNYTEFEDEEKQKRNILISLVLITAIAGTLYSIFYNFLGVYSTNLPIGIYVSFCILNLLQFYYFKHYASFRTFQLIGILLFPTATHYLNGGYDQSSVVVLAAMLSPLGALMFHSAKGAKLFFYLFIVMIAFASFSDFYMDIPRTEIPQGIKMLFYFFNIITITSICFLLLQKFLADSEKSKALLKTKNEELSTEKMKVESALNDLRSAQTQLIQSEKMASLGELTAGIAHEIQNPLNFVNNFSEVTLEIFSDLQTAIAKDDKETIASLFQDVQLATEKINFHGKRASDIVKSMLHHSRTSTGQKELTNINDLCDEYMRLAYHGLRAKESSFISAYELQLDGKIEAIFIRPQEIGRVLLNLINNAFYAVNERAKQKEPGYNPKVILTTDLNTKQVIITLEDNGIGIPDSIKGKIFQPFFTTKPSGQGTGLGLSLSYDIIKSHGGTIFIESELNQFTRFIINLPISSSEK